MKKPSIQRVAFRHLEKRATFPYPDMSFTEKDMDKIAQRFCDFLLKQEFEYVTFRFAYHDKDTYAFSDGEGIVIESVVRTNTWKWVEVEYRGRKRMSKQPVNYFEHGYRGIDVGKLFKGTKYLSRLKTAFNTDNVGIHADSNTETILLHWRKWNDPERRKLMYKELEAWLDKNGNKKLPREAFGFPPI